VNYALGFDFMTENREVTTLFLYLTARENHQPFTGSAESAPADYRHPDFSQKEAWQTRAQW